jgi:hypothetical protein
MDKTFLFAGLFFVFIFLSGFWLNRTGKPFNGLLLTAHKLISLAVVVYLVITLYRIYQAAPLSLNEIALCVVTFLLFIVLIATGGLLSTAKTIPAVILKIHQIMPFLALISTATTLYLLLIRKQ